MDLSLATVCLSGTLVEKLHAAAAAGFDGVEIFEPDLVASDHSPEEVRALAARLGLRLDMYQPFRDFEGVEDDLLEANLRRAEAKLVLMERLGTELMLVPSNVATATVDSDEVIADQLRRLGDLAQRHGARVAYEALAWGTHVDDYRRAARIVALADHPAIGTCLDSFHILARGHDPAAIADLPAESIFYLQLADAPALSMDVLSWSRHHRLFPGEGSFDLAGFLELVLRAGYTGPLSLEVFNDTFRQTDPGATALHARRSLGWLQDQTARRYPSSAPVRPDALTASAPPRAVDFVEIKAEDTTPVEVLLRQLGFAFRGRHRSKPVRLWTLGSARLVLNEQQARDQSPHVAALGFLVDDPAAAAARAEELVAPPVFRRTDAAELPLPGVVAPDGTEVFWAAAGAGEPAWVAEFEGGEPATAGAGGRVDHVNLAQPWQQHDEAVLFHASVLGLRAERPADVPGPVGFVRSQVMRSADGAVRIPLNVVPPLLDDGTRPTQHVAVAVDDVAAAVRAGREAGLETLPVPGNYYDDLAARLDLEPEVVERLKDLDLLYDRSEDGEFVHAYTRTVGSVFLELVERRRGYDGYGAGNAPVRLTAQHDRGRRG